jgi:hypothetical protein
MAMNKFVKALARHELAVNGLAAATSAIGNELAKCPIQVELDRLLGLQWNGESYSEADKLRDNQYRTKTHLWRAFSGDGQDRLDDDEITEYLADDETGCPRCARAWELIHERKKARQELGVARRLIRYYGKQALLMAEDDQ